MKQLYEKYCLPLIINCVCRSRTAAQQRQNIVPMARGNVLEIGIGSGLNLPFYRTDLVKSVIGLDPSERLWKLRDKQLATLPFQLEFLPASAESIPLESNSIDTILTTYTLCTVPDLATAFQEMHRVLKPGGKLLFSEHGLAPEAHIQRWQNRLNPVWKQVSGGCNLNRNIPQLLDENGFKIEALESQYLSNSLKFASYHFAGTAVGR